MRKIPILMYHKINYPKQGAKLEGLYVTPPNFAKQMGYLYLRGYKTISLVEVIEYLKSNLRLPSRPMVITFDDGYKDNYTYAYPILKKYGFTATIFVVTDSIGKVTNWPESVEVVKEEMLSWEEIREMSDNGISIEGHTLSHPHLAGLSEEEVRYEVEVSKKVLEGRLNKPVRFLAYPYGDYNETVKRVARDCGYWGCLSTESGKIDRSSDPYALRRLMVKGHYRLVNFIFKLLLT